MKVSPVAVVVDVALPIVKVPFASPDSWRQSPLPSPDSFPALVCGAPVHVIARLAGTVVADGVSGLPV